MERNSDDHEGGILQRAIASATDEIAARHRTGFKTVAQWEAELASLREQVERVKRERDEAHILLANYKYFDGIPALEAALREAKEALEPFADANKFIIEDLPDDYKPDWSPFIAYGDYRRARAALTRLTTLSDRKTDGGAK